jgi:membrane protein implicated in regulation of membrane protease activity
VGSTSTDQQEVPWTSKDRELAAVLPEYWTNFAKNGDANGPGLPVWPGFRESRDTVMFLGEELRPEAIPGERNLKRLDRIYAIAKFASRYLYWMLALAILVVAAFLVMLVMGYRRWARRRRERIATMRRVLRFPVSQMVVAIPFIAIPFAVVSTPFNLFVTDKPLRRVGAVLLTAIVLGAYWAYVRRNPGGIRRISNYRKQRLGGHAGERAWIYPDRRSGRNRDSLGGF